METFFPEGSIPRFWGPAAASITNIACSSSWPPSIAVAGLAPCMRAWRPDGKGDKTQFKPVTNVVELDGHRFVAVAMEGSVLAAADASHMISIWATDTWERQQVLEVGSPITSLSLSTLHLVVGTAAGTCSVWRRVPGEEFMPLFQQPLQVDQVPVVSVGLGLGPDDTEILVVHSRGNNGVGVWRLSDGKLVQRMARDTPPDDTLAVTLANVTHMLVRGSVMAGVSYFPGQDPIVQLLDVLSRQGELLQAPDRLKGRGKPLCADFDGALLVVGFEDGALATFGYRGWLRWHAGAVGAVALVPERGQVLSGGADGYVRLCSTDGNLLSEVDCGFEVTALVCHGVFAVVGGVHGELQILVLPAVGDAQQSSSHPPLSAERQAAFQAAPVQCRPYGWCFDARGAKHGGSGACGAVKDHLPAFFSFAPPVEPVQASHFARLREAGRHQPTPSTGEAVQPTEEQLAAAQEAVKKQQLQQMGEAKGVARNSGVVSLPSSVEQLGRKCDSRSCLNRSGMSSKPFMRCGGCKVRLYCSQHCQRTHWRDAHSKECKALAAESARQQAAEERQAAAGEQAGGAVACVQAVGAAGTAGVNKSGEAAMEAAQLQVQLQAPQESQPVQQAAQQQVQHAQPHVQPQALEQPAQAPVSTSVSGPGDKGDSGTALRSQEGLLSIGGPDEGQRPSPVEVAASALSSTATSSSAPQAQQAEVGMGAVAAANEVRAVQDQVRGMAVGAAAAGAGLLVHNCVAGDAGGGGGGDDGGLYDLD